MVVWQMIVVDALRRRWRGLTVGQLVEHTGASRSCSPKTTAARFPPACASASSASLASEFAIEQDSDV